MNRPSKTQGLSASLVLIALLLPVSLRAEAEAEAPGENARELLDAALAYKMPPGSYKKVTVEEEEGLTSTDCEYLKIMPGGARLSHIETEFRGGRFVSRYLDINDADGSWSLCDDRTAIRLPDHGEFFQAPVGEPAYKTHALELRRVTEKGVDFIVITSRSTDAEMSETRAVAEKVTKQLGVGAPTAGARKQMSKRVTDRVPAQVEFWLKEPTRHLFAMRYLTKRGSLIMEQRVDDDAYERIADLPAEMFTIPEGYARLRPTGLMEAIGLLRKHRSESARLKPKTEAEAATPPGVVANPRGTP